MTPITEEQSKFVNYLYDYTELLLKTHRDWLHGKIDYNQMVNKIELFSKVYTASLKDKIK